MPEQNAFEGAIVAIKGSSKHIEFACSIDTQEPHMGILTRVDAIIENSVTGVPSVRNVYVTQGRVALSCLEIIKPRSSKQD